MGNTTDGRMNDLFGFYSNKIEHSLKKGYSIQKRKKTSPTLTFFQKENQKRAKHKLETRTPVFIWKKKMDIFVH